MSQEKISGPFNNIEEKRVKTPESVDEKKKVNTKNWWDSIKKNIKTSAILGLGGAMSLNANSQNINQKADQIFVDAKNPKKEYVIEDGHVFQVKNKRNGSKVMKYKGEAQGIAKQEDADEKAKDNHTADYVSYNKTENKAYSKRPEGHEGHIGEVSGSGESFRAEVPYSQDGKPGIRLFKGVEGEKEFREWEANFSKSGGIKNGGKPGKGEETRVENKNISSKDDESFYQEIKTSSGVRKFEGAKGKKEFEEFTNRMKNLNNRR